MFGIEMCTFVFLFEPLSQRKDLMLFQFHCLLNKVYLSESDARKRMFSGATDFVVSSQMIIMQM